MFKYIYILKVLYKDYGLFKVPCPVYAANNMEAEITLNRVFPDRYPGCKILETESIIVEKGVKFKIEAENGSCIDEQTVYGESEKERYEKLARYLCEEGYEIEYIKIKDGVAAEE